MYTYPLQSKCMPIESVQTTRLMKYYLEQNSNVDMSNKYHWIVIIWPWSWYVILKSVLEPKILECSALESLVRALLSLCWWADLPLRHRCVYLHARAQSATRCHQCGDISDSRQAALALDSSISGGRCWRLEPFVSASPCHVEKRKCWLVFWKKKNTFGLVLALVGNLLGCRRKP